MIKRIDELANKLSNGGSVEVAKVSKALSKRVELWVKRKEIEIVNGVIVGRF